MDSAVYVRYKDHVFYKNVKHPLADAVERETLGWLIKQTDEIILVEHDRTALDTRILKRQGNGLIILKSCIVEIRRLLLQENSNCHLKARNTDNQLEYALQPKKRKTPKQNGAGAK
jgi:hypothetical protein